MAHRIVWDPDQRVLRSIADDPGIITFGQWEGEWAWLISPKWEPNTEAVERANAGKCVQVEIGRGQRAVDDLGDCATLGGRELVEACEEECYEVVFYAIVASLQAGAHVTSGTFDFEALAAQLEVFIETRNALADTGFLGRPGG